MKNNLVLIFLGSGTTAGSDIKRNGKILPTDQNFFKKAHQINKNWEKCYPALKLCRDELPGMELPSLFRVWNQLFIFRGLVRAKLCDDNSLIQKFEELKNHDWPQDYQWRKEHYSHHFDSIPLSGHKPYYLSELAIFDLRVLVKDIYSNLNIPGNPYKILKEKLKEELNRSIVVNLNYDTTFDDHNGKGFSPLQEREAKCENLENKIIRPHGSLKWTSKCRFSLNSKNWILPWEETFKETDLKNQGYSKTSKAEELIFHQALIVPPAYFKEEIIGNSTIPGLVSQVLWNQWRHLEKALIQAEKLLFYGTSLASGDDHLCFLIRKYIKGKKIKVIDLKKEDCEKEKFEMGWRDRFKEAYFNFDYVPLIE